MENILFSHGLCLLIACKSVVHFSGIWDVLDRIRRKSVEKLGGNIKIQAKYFAFQFDAESILTLQVL